MPTLLSTPYGHLLCDDESLDTMYSSSTARSAHDRFHAMSVARRAGMAEVRADICQLQRGLRAFLQTVIGTVGTVLQTVTGTVVNYIQTVNF